MSTENNRFIDSLISIMRHEISKATKDHEERIKSLEEKLRLQEIAIQDKLDQVDIDKGLG